MRLRRLRSLSGAFLTLTLLAFSAGVGSDTLAQGAAPANAYPVERSFGNDWRCLHGFREVDRARCDPVVVPENGYLDAAGDRWKCDRGFRRAEGVCVLIVLPANSFLAEHSDDPGWECERGYRSRRDACVPIVVPQHAYLSPGNYGAGWTCERGFRAVDGACHAVNPPANAYLIQSQYSSGWKCERGFAAIGEACVAVDPPAGAHLNVRGDGWECDWPLRREAGQCIGAAR